MKAIFTISLDFELHWGGFEKWPLKLSDYNPLNSGSAYLTHNPSDYANYFLNTRRLIPEMLRLFREHEVHVTWATVGMLFHGDRTQLVTHSPDQKPGYVEQQLSAYRYIADVGIGEDESSDPFHYA